MLDHEKKWGIQAGNKLPKETLFKIHSGFVYMKSQALEMERSYYSLFLHLPQQGYHLPAEDNIKLIIYTASNKEKEERKHLQTGSMFKDIPQV